MKYFVSIKKNFTEKMEMKKNEYLRILSSKKINYIKIINFRMTIQYFFIDELFGTKNSISSFKLFLFSAFQKKL